MVNSFEHIKFKEQVIQSEAFGEQYQNYFESNDTPAVFNYLVFDDISDILNGILLKYEHLTEFQKDALYYIFNAFDEIRTQIDPNRLKSFEHHFNTDDELLLYRETDKGLTNIIIHSDECIAFSFISKMENKRLLKFYELDGDFEEISYNFFIS